jgi:hypothetical protein
MKTKCFKKLFDSLHTNSEKFGNVTSNPARRDEKCYFEGTKRMRNVISNPQSGMRNVISRNEVTEKCYSEGAKRMRNYE